MNSRNNISWLCESNDPSLKYRVLTELEERSLTESEISTMKSQILESKHVNAILSKMHNDGYWLQTNPRTKQTAGDGVEYGSFATTHFCLSYLAELGLTKEHPLVAKAAERYLSLLKQDGDWYQHLSCLYAFNIRTFVMLGYRHDPRLQKTIDLLLLTNRRDGGYLCDMHEKKSKTKFIKSCIRGSVKALLAFSVLPEFWVHPRCKELVNYFLDREGIFKMSDKSQLINNDFKTLSFPVTWGASLWEVLYALSKMGFGSDERLNRAWQLLDNQKNNEGLYILGHTPALCPWKVGKPGDPNKWLTFYVLLACKYRDLYKVI